MTLSEFLARLLFASDVTEITWEPMRRAILAVVTTDMVLPVLEIRMRRSSFLMIGVVISPTKET